MLFKSRRWALLNMSHRKCVSCECRLHAESKDVTIDHFLPKSTNPDKNETNCSAVCMRIKRRSKPPFCPLCQDSSSFRYSLLDTFAVLS